MRPWYNAEDPAIREKVEKLFRLPACGLKITPHGAGSLPSGRVSGEASQNVTIGYRPKNRLASRFAATHMLSRLAFCPA